MVENIVCNNYVDIFLLVVDFEAIQKPINQVIMERLMLIPTNLIKQVFQKGIFALKEALPVNRKQSVQLLWTYLLANFRTLGVKHANLNIITLQTKILTISPKCII